MDKEVSCADARQVRAKLEHDQLLRRRPDDQQQEKQEDEEEEQEEQEKGSGSATVKQPTQYKTAHTNAESNYKRIGNGRFRIHCMHSRSGKGESQHFGLQSNNLFASRDDGRRTTTTHAECVPWRCFAPSHARRWSVASCTLHAPELRTEMTLKLAPCRHQRVICSISASRLVESDAATGRQNG